jgi:hypothetical protein
MSTEYRYKQALQQIAQINDLSEVEESLTKLFFEMNDMLIEIKTIAQVALEDEEREEQSFDQTAEEFEPFPDEIEKCPKCGKPMIRRHGKNGDFYGCAGFPNCRHTRNIDSEEIQAVAVHKSDLVPHVPDSMQGEYKMFEDGLKSGDLNDQMETDEIFTGSHGPFGG